MDHKSFVDGIVLHKQHYSLRIMPYKGSPGGPPRRKFQIEALSVGINCAVLIPHILDNLGIQNICRLPQACNKRLRVDFTHA